jgi:hypothetical protein
VKKTERREKTKQKTSALAKCKISEKGNSYLDFEKQDSF